MSHFYLRMQPGRGREVTRRAHKAEGATATATGWHIGGVVEIDHIDGHDVVTFYVTDGSAGHTRRAVAQFRLLGKGTIEEIAQCEIKF